jgi:hypothetical protein
MLDHALSPLCIAEMLGHCLSLEHMERMAL